MSPQGSRGGGVLAPSRDLEVLDAIAENHNITQRTLASRLGIAVGMANLYVKRLVRKGYIKCVNVRANRIRYLITPQGIAEKSRLTYQFLEYSLHLFGQVRQHLREVLAPCASSASNRVAIYGTGEAAELAYLAIRELGLEVSGVFNADGGGAFLVVPVQRFDDVDSGDYDWLVVATLDPGDDAFDRLARMRVPPAKLLPLRPQVRRP